MNYFVDTNIFIRIITKDDLKKADSSSKYLQQIQKEKGTLFLTTVTLFELAWLLKSFYQLNNQQIEEKLSAIKNTEGIKILPSIDGDLFVQAAELSNKKGIDLIDAYYIQLMKHYNIKNIITYDNDFKKLAGIKIIQP